MMNGLTATLNPLAESLRVLGLFCLLGGLAGLVVSGLGSVTLWVWMTIHRAIPEWYSLEPWPPIEPILPETLCLLGGGPREGQVAKIVTPVDVLHGHYYVIYADGNNGITLANYLIPLEDFIPSSLDVRP
jgi:hypothetical protein